MADEEVVPLESKASAEQQVEAEKIGWIPATRYKGKPEDFVDADEYIKRGETVLPIVKEQNRRLHETVKHISAAQEKTQAALDKALEALDTIEERHSVETQKAVEAARRQLKADLAAASEAQDHQAVAELTDQLTQLKDAERPAKKETKPDTSVADAEAQRVLTETQSWWNDNASWYGVDRRKTSLALGIAQELREGGETAQGPAFFKLVKAEVEKTFAPETPRSDKVEGGRNGDESDSRQRSGGKKDFNSLPADARAACKADERKFVGPDKRYKTAAEWHAKYAEIYYSMEAA